MFCSSVFFCEKKNALESRGESFLLCWIFLSLTELTDLTEHYCALFRYHRTPSAYRYHRTFQLKKGVGWWLLGVDD